MKIVKVSKKKKKNYGKPKGHLDTQLFPEVDRNIVRKYEKKHKKSFNLSDKKPTCKTCILKK